MKLQGLRFSNSRISKFFAILEKKLFSTSTVLDSLLINSRFSLRKILPLFMTYQIREA